MTDYKPTFFGVASDYDYSATHKRDRIEVWSAPFMSTWEAEGYSLPDRSGYMLTTYNGDKVKVVCPIREDDTYLEVDKAINEALNAHFESIGARSLL